MALSLVAVVLACRGKEPATVQTPPPADTPPVAAAAPAATIPAAVAVASVGLPTDEELMTYLTWLRDWKQLANRNKAELDAVTERVAATLSVADTGKIAQDPDVLATIARNGETMRAHFDLKPKGRTTDAMQAALEGLGLTVPFFTYTGVRDEEALARARRMYGDAVVDWILERESTIASVLSQ
jgi:hypothetical protein